MSQATPGEGCSGIRYLELPFPRKISMVRRMGVREQGLAAKLEALRTTFLRNDAVRFVMVGSLGFAIDAAILAGLVHGAHWSPFLSRAVAMTTAVLCTWLLDLRVTPRKTSHSPIASLR